MTQTRVLALDLGDRRIGLACSDPTGFLATPIGLYVRSSPAADIAYIAQLATEREAGVVVVGLPVNMNGSEGSQAEKARTFADSLRKRGLVVELWDERLTTVEATRVLQEQGMKRKRIERHIDEMAATLILEGYLLSRRERQRHVEA